METILKKKQTHLEFNFENADSNFERCIYKCEDDARAEQTYSMQACLFNRFNRRQVSALNRMTRVSASREIPTVINVIFYTELLPQV